ncbi:MAG: hypothetical protein WCZ66_12035 [Sphingomonadaceae bacterium]
MTFARRSMPADFAHFAQGKSVKQLRAHYRAGASTVTRWLAQSGIKPIRTHHDIPADLAERAKATSIADMARHYGIPPSTLRKMLKREGIKAALHEFRRFDVPADFAERCAELTRTALARHYGRSYEVVARWLAETGLTPQAYVPIYNRPKLRYVRSPGHSNVATVKRDTGPEEMAAEALRRFAPVYRCDEQGLAAQYGKLWRLGNIIIDGDELIARAARKVAA